MIAPDLLIAQVQNTLPFLFDRSPGPRAQREPKAIHLRWLREFARTGRLEGRSVDEPLGYFKLALAAHHATVAGLVPTDVDIHIRFKLWNPSELNSDAPEIPMPVLMEMAQVVLQSRFWSEKEVSTRFLDLELEGLPIQKPAYAGLSTLSGHQGEWFSTAAAAYGALNRRSSSPEALALAEQVGDAILHEIAREAEIYRVFRERRQPMALLKAATIIAHNLGDLDQVIDLWKLGQENALRKQAYKLGHPGDSRTVSARLLAEAGELNKRVMADENHRHFVLRPVRALRRAKELMVPVGPFFDEWGIQIAQSPLLDPKDRAEIVEALVQGALKLPRTFGYARAIAGIESRVPGGRSALEKQMPARWAKELRTGHLREKVSESQSRFEERLCRSVLKFIDHPSE